MNLVDFIKDFPDEESCKLHFKGLRDAQVKICPKCGCTEYYWKNDKEMYECKRCHYRMSLKKGTVMEHSQLTFRDWYVAFHLMSSTKKSISACELQRQLNKSCYRTVWELTQKIRDVMGQRDENYTLSNEVEIDEMFFETTCLTAPIKKSSGRLKRGVGSQQQTKVLVMAESVPVDDETREAKEKKSGKKYRVKKSIGHIKMSVIGDLKSETIKEEASKSIEEGSKVASDGTNSHVKLTSKYELDSKNEGNNVSEVVKEHLPWVHIVAGKCKKMIVGIHDQVERFFLQLYLNEFCYKFNRRFFDDLFPRLLVAAVSYKPRFRHNFRKLVGN